MTFEIWSLDFGFQLSFFLSLPRSHAPFTHSPPLPCSHAPLLPLVPSPLRPLSVL